MFSSLATSYVLYNHVIIYEVHSTIIFPGSRVSDFSRNSRAQKLNKAQTDKVSEHNRRAVFSRVLIFHTHQQKWRHLCFILYPLFILLPHNLRQLPFSPPPPLEHTAAILDRMSVPPGGKPLPPPLLILHLRRFLCRPFLNGRQETEPLFGANRCIYAWGGTPFLIPPLLYILP